MTTSSTRFVKYLGLASLTLAGAGAWMRAGDAQAIRQVATLRAARAVHTATTLPSGDVLFVGGMAGGGARRD